jgi:excinuclease ABC subunit A
VHHDSPESIYANLMAKAEHQPDLRIALTFPVELPGSATQAEIEQWLSVSGFTRVQAQREVASATGSRKVLDVVADRFRLTTTERARVVEAIEVALKHGAGRTSVYVLDEAASGRGSASDGAPTIFRYSTGLHCADSDIRYTDPITAWLSPTRRKPCARGPSSRCKRPLGKSARTTSCATAKRRASRATRLGTNLRPSTSNG